ncbi:ribosome hibernation-promoting factor, HPF/YfiA family [Pseudoroseomonas cervicalis]|uniref:ribosome hibernation-promoting factor, HPF/YfiA family n=1 Tax=Teichococcus cervicalis TaxID=204525 RepID=UPI0027884E59|nr:ribosome-associated translation inhibitor RaiA [Pseudoroseomonas cervicalis]MDQ1080778.1 ribosomal subunit interface protein [Pseudoroseomonas cervicalis]
MHIVVAGKQVETGEALKVHVAEGLTTVTKKYFDHALEAYVTFSKNRAFFGCTIDIHAGRGLSLRGEGEGADAHRAFDEAASHIAKRLRRYRRRMNEHSRGLADERLPASAETARQVILAQPVDEPEEPVDVDALLADIRGTTPADRPDPAVANGHDLADNGEHGAIIAETPTEIARLSVSEAVMRLDLGQMPVMMFRNRSSGQLNVVYRRQDGHIGWIDPAAA